jgi:hypothetical protein
MGMLGAREMLRLASRSEMTHRIISATLVTDQNCRHGRREQAPAQWLKSQDFNSDQLGPINSPLSFSWRSIDHLPEVGQAVLRETGSKIRKPHQVSIVNRGDDGSPANGSHCHTRWKLQAVLRPRKRPPRSPKDPGATLPTVRPGSGS